MIKILCVPNVVSTSVKELQTGERPNILKRTQEIPEETEPLAEDLIGVAVDVGFSRKNFERKRLFPTF